jgi:2-haloacid dehalogenase
MKLSDFDVLSFDCYGTLIDWESGLYAALAPLRSRVEGHISRDVVLEAFALRESSQQSLTPEMPYSDLLAEVHGQLAAGWGVTRDLTEDTAFGQSVGDWPPFPDTVEALQYLKKHYRLVVLSNVDHVSFAVTGRCLAVAFDSIYTAQDIGSYKPDPRNFAYLLARQADQGTARERILHVAQSLFHDHAPANAAGLASAWIDRRYDRGGSGATAPVSVDVRYDFRFASLIALAEAHRAETALTR